MINLLTWLFGLKRQTNFWILEKSYRAKRADGSVVLRRDWSVYESRSTPSLRTDGYGRVLHTSRPFDTRGEAEAQCEAWNRNNYHPG